MSRDSLREALERNDAEVAADERAEAETPPAEPEQPVEPEQPAEPEPDVEPEQPAEEPEPQPDEAPPRSEKELEALQRKLDAEAARHDRRVRELLGPDVQDFEPCPLCYTPGFALSYVGQPIDPQQIEAVQALLGLAPEADYRDDPNVEACPTCDALGMVRTGSKVPEHVVRACPTCNGSGFRTRADYTPPPPPAPYAQANGPVPAAAFDWTPPPPPVTAGLG